MLAGSTVSRTFVEKGEQTVNIPNQATTVTWDTYLRQPYWSEEGSYRKGIFVEEAEFVARQLSAKTAPHQLRQFYNQVKATERRFGSASSALALYVADGPQNHGESFSKLQGELYALLPKANYAYQRKLVPDFFVRFMKVNIEKAVESEKQFQGFVYHFESVIAYFKER